MKILLYSYVFFPKVGGVETVSLTLANGLINEGCACQVITETPAEAEDTFAFKVWRMPDSPTRKRLIDWADIVIFNGASLAMQLTIQHRRKPFVWIHVGYQVSCIDGLGWVEGFPAPLKPWPSILFHARRSGLGYAFKEGLKLYLRKFTANYLAAKNIAITHWMQQTQPLRNQSVIYNPFPLDQFKCPDAPPEKEYDFIYVGRLVSEKGVGTLVQALKEAIVKIGKPLFLLVIGDGNRRFQLEELARSCGVWENITFAGRKTGQELVNLVYSAPIAIVPSEWYEPMGGTALELLSAGRALIVSEKGGLKECVGNAGITFQNGDYKSLAKAMLLLHENIPLQSNLAGYRPQVLATFDTQSIIRQYIDLCSMLTKKK